MPPIRRRPVVRADGHGVDEAVGDHRGPFGHDATEADKARIGMPLPCPLERLPALSARTADFRERHVVHHGPDFRNYQAATQDCATGDCDVVDDVPCLAVGKIAPCVGATRMPSISPRVATPLPIEGEQSLIARLPFLDPVELRDRIVCGAWGLYSRGSSHFDPFRSGGCQGPLGGATPCGPVFAGGRPARFLMQALSAPAWSIEASRGSRPT